MIASHLTTGAASLSVGFMVIWSAVSPPPPIDLQSVLYDVDTGVVTYQREVNAKRTVRAPWITDVVELETEQAVPECSNEGWADYGPQENTVQTFDLARFAGPDCRAALEAGKTYTIVATVNPIDGPGSQVRSAPFTVPDEQE
jgi:hypothetical protein